jgi:hypothetical protein
MDDISFELNFALLLWLHRTAAAAAAAAAAVLPWRWKADSVSAEGIHVEFENVSC